MMARTICSMTEIISLGSQPSETAVARSTTLMGQLARRQTLLEMPLHLRDRRSTTEHNDGHRDSGLCLVGFECPE